MNLPEYMSLTTSTFFIEGVSNFINNNNPLEREGEALSFGGMLNDLQMDFFTFIKTLLETLAIINIVRGTYISSQDIERIEVLIREVSHWLNRTKELTYLNFNQNIDDSFIRLCDNMDRVNLTVKTRGEYEITFKNGTINIK